MVIQSKLMCDIMLQLRLAEVIEKFREFTQRNYFQRFPNRWEVWISVFAEMFTDIPLFRPSYLFFDGVKISLETSLVYCLR